MISQVMRLCRLQLGNLFGINVIIHTKDKAKKYKFIALSVVWIMLIFMAVGYVSAFSYGLASMGMAVIIPMYLYAIASIIILFFSFFKAGNTLFAMKGYEMMISLPVSRASIIISRYLCMYFMDMLVEMLIMIPGLVVYSCFEQTSLIFYLVFILGSLFLPLLPLTISSVLGAIITAVSSRARHRSFVETILTMILALGVMIGSFWLSDNESMLTEEMLKNMADLLSQQIGGIYPPAIWFTKALSGEIVSFCLLLGVPAVIFTVFVAILQKYFQRICGAIHSVASKNDFKMTKLKKNSHIVSLWHKELKRYFASSVYVTNTMICFAMAVILSMAVFFMGIEQIETVLGIPDIGAVLIKCIPFAVSCIFCMVSTTACSISIEGNTFWQIQALPVNAKEVYDSKILVNLSVAFPFYLISVIFLGLALKPSLSELVWLVVLPVVYLCFSSVLGISVNLTFPNFEWENEVSVVKQSASMMIAMFTGVLSGVIPILAIVFMNEKYTELIRISTIVLILIITGLLYKSNQKKELMKVGTE